MEVVYPGVHNERVAKGAPPRAVCDHECEEDGQSVVRLWVVLDLVQVREAKERDPRREGRVGVVRERAPGHDLCLCHSLVLALVLALVPALVLRVCAGHTKVLYQTRPASWLRRGTNASPAARLRVLAGGPRKLTVGLRGPGGACNALRAFTTQGGYT